MCDAEQIIFRLPQDADDVERVKEAARAGDVLPRDIAKRRGLIDSDLDWIIDRYRLSDNGPEGQSLVVDVTAVRRVSPLTMGIVTLDQS